MSLYILGVDRIETQVNRTFEIQLDQATRQVNEQLTQLEVTLSQWAFNPIFGTRLRDKLNWGQELELANNLYKTLIIMRETNPLIAEVYLYVEPTNKLITGSGGVNAVSDPVASKALHNLLQGEKDMYWTSTLPELTKVDILAPKQSFKYTLVHRIAGSIPEKYGAIIVQLNTDKIGTYFKDFGDAGTSLLIDSQGDSLSTQVSKRGYTPLETSLKNTVLQRLEKQNLGTFILKDNNRRYSASFGTISRLGTHWIFATATDVSQFSAPVVIMSRLILTVSLAGILAAILLAWFASKRLYRPVAKLIGEWQGLSEERQLLQTKVEEQLPTLMESFMLQLVQGRLYYLNEKELAHRLAYYGWDMDDNQVAILVLQLSGLDNAEGKFKTDDEQLVTFAAANIVNELTKLRFSQSHIINFQDLSVGILVKIPRDPVQTTLKLELKQLSADICSALHQTLHLQATLCLGQLRTELGLIPDTMEEARRTLKYGNLTNMNTLLDMEELIPRGEYTFFYPFEIEKDLIHAMRLGQEEDAIRFAERFVAELKNSDGVELFLHQAMAQLLGNIQNALLQAGFHVYAFYEGQNLFEELLGIRQSPDMLKWLIHRIILPCMQELDQSHNKSLSKRVETIVRLVDEKYMTDISLEACADLIGIHISTLSKAFKTATGMTFLDYVLKVRIEASQKLLIETDLKISEIAEMVGYQHSWFHRVFKKYVGITPTEYREKHS
ncbi:helix-turn-helix domain-containing protein [Paenibacillus roseipurpureus]|uniref:Helix-turn-helix domain-containing protein n=1 Tax=Paenibacillus roseopurpureus TaxID=2918901 RepID=A0AA96LRK1_9BACL|nr:helix-turn-helix domain-containing protein [Paenibacillus sp. MBLB1832]WNR46013.1 helix-turn-helix domain-containing protein [Paenibacillus sp. MBLB1832]